MATVNLGVVTRTDIQSPGYIFSILKLEVIVQAFFMLFTRLTNLLVWILGLGVTIMKIALI